MTDLEVLNHSAFHEKGGFLVKRKSSLVCLSVCTRAVIDIADIDVSIKMSFDIHIDTEKRHIDIGKCYMYIV